MGVRIDLARLAGTTDHPDRSTDEPEARRRLMALPRLPRRRTESTTRTTAS